MRILVTGSRDWDDPSDLRVLMDALADALSEAAHKPDTVLVSGHCGTGADFWAETMWKVFGLPIETHPANWFAYGKRAGYVRNAHMVKLGADLCLAFIKNNSPGATMTARLAEDAGIPVRYFRATA